MDTKRVLLVFGGQSSEHEVSLLSARNVHAALDGTKHTITLCYITRDGQWKHVASLENLDGPTLVPILGTKQFVSGTNQLPIDVILPILHGKHGEDGEVQGLASLMHIPCVGPSLIGAAVTMDKDITKHQARNAGVPVVDWELWHIHTPQPNYGTLASRLGETMFIKPSNAGSSIGVSKVRTEEELHAALNLAAEHDSIVLIEAAIDGIEVQISVLGNDNPKVTEICEIESTTDFHDFEDKYSKDSTVKFHIPARLSQEQTTRIKRYAIDVYCATRGRGMARIDFFVLGENTEYLNEINSIPGFTNVSVYPMLWQSEGINQSELLDMLIAAAFE